jgi:hypothetical protein
MKTGEKVIYVDYRGNLRVIKIVMINDDKIYDSKNEGYYERHRCYSLEMLEDMLTGR